MARPLAQLLHEVQEARDAWLADAEDQDEKDSPQHARFYAIVSCYLDAASLALDRALHVIREVDE